jgi:hypothetical protein
MRSVDALETHQSLPCLLAHPCRAMFEDADFVVDEEADEYKALHPNAEART